MQVELDTLPPETLRQLFQDAIDRDWGDDAHSRVLDRERAVLATIT